MRSIVAIVNDDCMVILETIKNGVFTKITDNAFVRNQTEPLYNTVYRDSKASCFM